MTRLFIDHVLIAPALAVGLCVAGFADAGAMVGIINCVVLIGRAWMLQ